MTKTYNKYNENEPFSVGDLVSIIPETSLVIRSCTKHYKKQDKLVLGICKSISDKTIEVINGGMVDVNVTGLICVGDKLTTSDVAGKAKAIRYANDDTRIFDVRSIGKVVGLYNDYSIAKVLLDIE